MRYLADIKRFIHLLLGSQRFHLLTVLGAPGWAKTHGTRSTLQELGVKYGLLGSYATPLALYNKLAEDPHQTLIVDDCAGVFSSPQAISVLNAACWPSADANGKRRVIWTSTTEKAATDAFDFFGKVIVLTNFIPETPQARAFVSRALNYRIELDAELVSELLIEAARSKQHYPDTATALLVAAFLGQHARFHDPGKISLRTLDLGYEFARLDPIGWQDLLVKALPKPTKLEPEQLVTELHDSTLRIEDQAARFSQMTGKSRRTFFYVREKLGLKNNVVPIGKRANKKTKLTELRS